MQRVELAGVLLEGREQLAGRGRRLELVLGRIEHRLGGAGLRGPRGGGDGLPVVLHDAQGELVAADISLEAVEGLEQVGQGGSGRWRGHGESFLVEGTAGAGGAVLSTVMLLRVNEGDARLARTVCERRPNGSEGTPTT